MNRQEKERLSKYGKLVWDFANSKTTDDVLTSFFENVQFSFNFSKDFAEKALTRFPTMEMTIGSLSNNEQKFFEILLNRNKIYSSCNAALNPSYCNIEKYDPIDLMFTISERKWLSNDTSDYTDETFLIPEREIDEYIDNVGLQYDEWKEDLKVELKTLAKLIHQIEDIKSASTNRFTEIEKIAEVYPKISKLHDYVKATQEKLKTILLQIIETEQAFESKGFKSMLSRYNRIHKRMLIINDDDSTLIEIDTFFENHFLKDISIIEYTDVFNAPISYCLIEYLKNPEYSGIERISVCQKCNFIFSKSRLNDRQVYCPVCSRKNKMTQAEMADYMKGYRANPAQKKATAKKKREEKIRHLMTNAGKTRKQAEIIIDGEM